MGGATFAGGVLSPLAFERADGRITALRITALRISVNPEKLRGRRP
ncbi:hypothetical protein ACGFZK_01775 [Streptomyces sp. NPDC048257]